MIRRILLIAATGAAWGTAWGVASLAPAHGVPIFVTTTEGGAKLAVLGNVPVAELAFDGFDVYASDPGVGVNLPSTGPPSGTALGIESTGGLLHWDGAQVAPTDAVLTIFAPEFDALGSPNVTAVDEYTLAAGSPPEAGMTWAVYPGDVGGGFLWDAHGEFLVSADGSPAAGLYGAPLRLVAMGGGPALAPSEPLLLPLLYDPAGTWTLGDVIAGVAALTPLVEAPLVGDFNGDGVVDVRDHDRWARDFGVAVATPGTDADGNRDGVVNLADYPVWRDAWRATEANAVPEPAAIVPFGLGLAANFRSRRPNDLFDLHTTIN